MADESLIAGKRCLVLDDEFLIALDIQQILENAGAARVVCVSNIADALTQLQRESFNAAVIDMLIDGQPCTEVAAELTRQRVPFVFLTGLSPDAAQVRQFPAAPLVAKPYGAERVLAALNAALRLSPP